MGSEMSKRDSFPLQSSEGSSPKIVLAPPADKYDPCTRSCGRDRLIRALATVETLELPAKQGFPGPGQALAGKDEVGV
jgi:hypothetical protein